MGLIRPTCRAGVPLLAAAWLVQATCAPARAQNATGLTPEQRRTLELVALGKARTELLDLVRSQPVMRDRTIGDWVAGDAGLDRDLRLWVRTRPRQGPSRLYSDSVCEADAHVTPAELAEVCLRLLEAYPTAAQGIDAEAIKSAARRWPELWATGRSSAPERAQADRPPGWEDVTREGMLLAQRAAEADAYAALLEEAGRLKVTNARRLREFLASSERVRDAVHAAVRREAASRADYEPDQIAVVQVRISIRDLLRILTRVEDEEYEGDEFSPADFREMALLVKQDELAASGLAPPPLRTILRNRYTLIEYDAPAWASQTRSATGRFVPQADESANAESRIEAARLEAIDELRKVVEALVIRDRVTVSEFAGYHQDLKPDIVLWLSGARITEQKAVAGGGVEVAVELPLRRLWEIVRRKMRLEEVEPPETQPASMPAVKEKP